MEATPAVERSEVHWLEPGAKDHGADPNATDRRGFTTLDRAAERGWEESVRLLLDRGAAPRPEAQGHTPGSFAAMRGHLETAALLAGW